MTKLIATGPTNTATDIERADRSQEKIVLLLDVSGSMNTTWQDRLDRLTAARNAIMTIVSTSRPNLSAYGLTTFSSIARIVVPITTQYSDIQGFRPYTEGATNLAGGINEAVYQKPNRAILLTDGEPTCSREACLEAARRAREAGIKIDCVAIGEAGDVLLQQIAEITGGTFSRCNDPNSLNQRYKMLESRNYLRLTHRG